MRIRLEIENLQMLRSGYRSKMVVTQQGANLGASEETDWPIQDNLGTIPDYVARIEAVDKRFVITALPGAKVFMNSASSPLRPNRQVFLRGEDKIRIGDLQIRILEQFIEEEDVDYMHLDDAVEVSSRVTKNKGYRDFLEAGVVVAQEPQTRIKSWTDRQNWENPVLVNAEDKDPIFSLNRTHYDAETFSEPPITRAAKEASANMAQDVFLSLKLEEEMPKNHSKRDVYGFEDVEDAEMIEVVAEEKTAEDELIAGNEVLITFSEMLGIPLSQIPESEMQTAMAEMAESLRVSVEGLHGIYQAEPSKNRGTFSQFNRNAIDDNPLRFSKSAEDALRTMFIDRSAVHLAPAAALRESLADLKQHQAATQSGIEAGLLAVVEAFRPENLEARFQSYKRSEIPEEGQARDAWKWRLFEAYFNELLSQRQHSLNKFFWEIFNSAYQENMREPNMATAQNQTKRENHDE